MVPTDQQFSIYRQTVLTALEEVENALIAYGQEQARRSQLVQTVEANRRVVTLSTALNHNSLGALLKLFDAQCACY